MDKGGMGHAPVGGGRGKRADAAEAENARLREELAKYKAKSKI